MSTENIGSMSTKFVRINKFVELTGYSTYAVRHKIAKKQWVLGVHYTKAPDGHVLINLEGYEKWAENTPVSNRNGTPVFKLVSNTKERGVGNASSLSPRPII